MSAFDLLHVCEQKNKKNGEKNEIKTSANMVRAEAGQASLIMSDQNLERTVFWTGPVDADSMERVIREIGDHLSENKEMVRLILSSRGGSIDVAIAFHDLIRCQLKWSAHLEIVAVGEASSSALTILMAADSRISTPDAMFVFHVMKRHYYEDSQLSIEDLREDADVMELKYHRVLKLIAAHVKKDDDNVRLVHKMCEDHNILSGVDMYELGLITHLQEN